MFQNLGLTEILIILVVILLLFGAKRIPEIAGSFGKHEELELNAPASASASGMHSGRARRYSRPAAPPRVGDSDIDMGTSASASATETETELDTDEVLSFSPKRRSPPTSYAEMRRSSTASNGTARARRPGCCATGSPASGPTASSTPAQRRGSPRKLRPATPASACGPTGATRCSAPTTAKASPNRGAAWRWSPACCACATT